MVVPPWGFSERNACPNICVPQKIPKYFRNKELLEKVPIIPSKSEIFSEISDDTDDR